MEIPELGTVVRYDLSKYVLVDVRFINPSDRTPTTALNGITQFLLKDYGWVDAELCVWDKSKKDEPRTYHILDWRNSLEPLPDNSKLPYIVDLLLAIQYDKEKHYGSSWKGKGEYRGIMANMDRKYDRLDKMTQDELSGVIKSLEQVEEDLQKGTLDPSYSVESKIDAVADLTNYGLLYMTWIKEKFPLCFKMWVDRNVPGYLRDKIGSI